MTSSPIDTGNGAVMASLNDSPVLKTITPAEKRAGLVRRVEKAEVYLKLFGFGWVAPLLFLSIGNNPKAQAKELWNQLGVPIFALCIFIALWGALAPKVQTSLGALPGPAQVWAQTEVIYSDYRASRQAERAFYDRQKTRNDQLLSANPAAHVQIHRYTGQPTFIDQIFTSLETVFAGFLLASLIAIPLGMLCGLSQTINAALNPLVQLFKPVSPLAWLPIVTMVVSALYTSNSPMLPKSFLVSAITVTLCSLWPTLINTAVGVASIDRDLINVGRVLRLTWWTKVRRLVLPSSLPYIFTGLRLSLGVGWMVLIAAEMLAQNPGLGNSFGTSFRTARPIRCPKSSSPFSPSALSASCSIGSCSRSRRRAPTR